MEILQLRYFLELAKTQHVSATANSLHISQPSLSATIRKLEREIGVELFIRKGRNIVLSPYGEVFKEYVEESFLSLENGKRAILKMRETDELTLNLGVLSPYMWEEVTNRFHLEHPKIQVNIFSVEESNYFENIISGETDFYLGDINRVENDIMPKIEYITLYEDDMVLLMNKSHPLADKEEISLRQCKNEKFINLNSNTSLQQFIDRMWEKAGIRPDVVMTCDYTLRDLMVAKDYGISVTTKRAAQRCDFPEVTFCKIADPVEKRRLGLVWRHNDKGFSEPMQKFYDVISDVYLK